MKYLFCTAFCLFSISIACSQDNIYSVNVISNGILFTGEESPFWFHSNRRGRMNEKSNVSAVLNGSANYRVTENGYFSFGIGVLYQDGYVDELQFDEAYVHYENSWLSATVGRKQREDLYRGLSATNENILWSLNARPLPGIGLRTIKPVYLWEEAGIAFQAALEEYITDDNRYVENARVHHKRFELVFDRVYNWEFSIGLDHYVQWAGTSPHHGRLPGSLSDYLDVVTGMEGDDDIEGEEANALGNHLGSYFAGIKVSTYYYDIELIYNHIFEDGSGMKLGNTPDGRYGIFITDKEPGKWIDAFMYEFYYTKHQSRTSSTEDGADNYFNNNVYRSGWTYDQRVIGVPFIFLDEDRYRIINNIVLAHHIGISGVAFENLPYRFLASYRMNYGAKAGGQLRSNILSTYLDLTLYENFLKINLQLGTDFSTVDAPNFGAGIQLSRILF